MGRYSAGTNDDRIILSENIVKHGTTIGFSFPSGVTVSGSGDISSWSSQAYYNVIAAYAIRPDFSGIWVNSTLNSKIVSIGSRSHVYLGNASYPAVSETIVKAF